MNTNEEVKDSKKKLLDPGPVMDPQLLPDSVLVTWSLRSPVPGTHRLSSVSRRLPTVLLVTEVGPPVPAHSWHPSPAAPDAASHMHSIENPSF